MKHAPRLVIGHVMHRRLRPASNAFVYPVFFVQLPLRALDACPCGVFSVDRWNLLSFRTVDHGNRDGAPLLPWIEARLREHGLDADGEIVLQCFPRVLGYVFNPVSFWFCHDRSGRLIAVLAEVNNTFGGTHGYLLHRHGEPLQDGEQLSHAKLFHVSPFCEVTGSYRFRFFSDRETLQARIDYDDAEGPLLLTAITGTPVAWSAANLLNTLLRMPLLTLGVIVRIHWQALKLWIKGVPFHGAHPSSPPARLPSLPQQEPVK